MLSSSSSSLERFRCLNGELDGGGTAVIEGDKEGSYEPSRRTRLGGVRERSDWSASASVEVDIDKSSKSASRSDDGRFRAVTWYVCCQ